MAGNGDTDNCQDCYLESPLQTRETFHYPKKFRKIGQRHGYHLSISRQNQLGLEYSLCVFY